MIDHIAIRVPFRDHWLHTTKDGELAFLTDDAFYSLPLRRTLTVSEDSDLEGHSVPYFAATSAHSTIAVKVFNPKVKGVASVEFKASPAKLEQGHNIWGSDDFAHCCNIIISAFSESCPFLARMVDWQHAELVHIDFTYHSWATSQHDAQVFIECLKNISYGQTRAAQDCKKLPGALLNYNSTAYFNPRSDRVRLKCYLKLNELLAQATSKNNGSTITDKMLAYCQGMLRWEARLYPKRLAAMGIDTRLNNMLTQYNEGHFTARDLWQSAFGQLFEAFKNMNAATLLRNDDIYQRILDALEPTRQTRRVHVVNDDAGDLFKLQGAGWKVAAKVEKAPNHIVYTMEKYSQPRGAEKLYAFFDAIREKGWRYVKETTPRQTFCRYLKVLRRAGFALAELQQFTAQENQTTVVPFVRFIEVSFENQRPLWAVN